MLGMPANEKCLILLNTRAHNTLVLALFLATLSSSSVLEYKSWALPSSPTLLLWHANVTLRNQATKVLYLTRSNTNAPSLSLGGQNGARLAGVVPGKSTVAAPCLHLVVDFTGYTKTSLPLHFWAVRPRTVAKCNGSEALGRKSEI